MRDKARNKISVNEIKSDGKILISVTLLGICFSVFAFIVAVRPEILQANKIISLQLTLAIPFFITSTLARSKFTYSGNVRMDRFAFYTFLVAYSFLLNSVGILLSYLVSTEIALAFFGMNIILALFYSFIEISFKTDIVRHKVFKDLVFIALITLLGIIPVLSS